ncbi:hypothetical protein OSTOST_11912, partial [Ostertagia ostertagi]
HISAYCSVWTLTLMALDRYLAVVYPVDSLTLRSPKNTIIALVVIYTIIVATQIPVGLMHGIYTYDFIIEERSTCAIGRLKYPALAIVVDGVCNELYRVLSRGIESQPIPI